MPHTLGITQVSGCHVLVMQTNNSNFTYLYLYLNLPLYLKYIYALSLSLSPSLWNFFIRCFTISQDSFFVISSLIISLIIIQPIKNCNNISEFCCVPVLLQPLIVLLMVGLIHGKEKIVVKCL